MPFKNVHSLAQHKSYFQGSCFANMTADEFNLLAPVEDYSKVLCKACGKELGKRGGSTTSASTTLKFLKTVGGGL